MNSLLSEIDMTLPNLAESTDLKKPIAHLCFYDTFTDWSWYLVQFDG